MQTPYKYLTRAIPLALALGVAFAPPTQAQQRQDSAARLAAVRAETAQIMELIEAENARGAQFRALTEARTTAAADEAEAAQARITLMRQRVAQAQEDAAELAAIATAITAETAALAALQAAYDERAAAQAANIRADIENQTTVNAAEQERAESRVALAQASAEQIRAEAGANLAALAALRETLDAEDPAVRRAALRQGLTSGDWVLQRAVLTMLLSESPMWVVEWARKSDANKTGTDLIRFHDFDPQTGAFQTTHDGTTKSGSVSRGGMVFEYPGCKVMLTMRPEGFLSGDMECSYNYDVVLRLF